MDHKQFSNLSLGFYVTYLFFEFPTGYLLQRLPTAKYLGLNGKAPAFPWRKDKISKFCFGFCL